MGKVLDQDVAQFRTADRARKLQARGSVILRFLRAKVGGCESLFATNLKSEQHRDGIPGGAEPLPTRAIARLSCAVRRHRGFSVPRLSYQCPPNSDDQLDHFANAILPNSFLTSFNDALS